MGHQICASASFTSYHALAVTRCSPTLIFLDWRCEEQHGAKGSGYGNKPSANFFFQNALCSPVLSSLWPPSGVEYHCPVFSLLQELNLAGNAEGHLGCMKLER